MNGKEFKDATIELHKRFDELKAKVAITTKEDELKELGAEMDEVSARLNQLIGERRATMKEEKLDFTKIADDKADEIEQRATDLLAGKAVKMSFASVNQRAKTTDTGILIPKHYDNNIREQIFPTVSSIYDMFTFMNVDGGESFTMPFEKSKAEAGVTEEGTPYHDIEGSFDYVEIGKKKLTAYFEISEEMLKLPKADYEAYLRAELYKALKRKIISLAINDDGTNGFAGILSSNANTLKVCPADKDFTIEAMDGKLLRKLQFSYGYADEVETPETLFMNKKDIATLALLDGKGSNNFAYVFDSKRKTLDNVPFCTPAVIPVYNTAKEALCGFYGDVSTYTIAIFSPVEVQRSTDYKFKENMVAYRASVFAGGAPSALCGLMRLKSKKAGA